MKTHVLGFPRVGANRELKWAQESFWEGDSSADELFAVEQQLKQLNWQTQFKAGLSYVCVGDFSLYDHVLDTIAMVGAVPARYDFAGDSVDITTYYRMARGDAAKNIPAMEMTKWFDTNYHFIVPEFTENMSFRLRMRKVIDDTKKAVELGYQPKPILLGPGTFLALGKVLTDFNRWDLMNDLIDVYTTVIDELSPLCEWIQIDEPILCCDLTPEERESIKLCLKKLSASTNCQLLLTTYFGVIDDNFDVVSESGCHGLHIDLILGKDQLDSVINKIQNNMILSLGVVDGRNIWKSNFETCAEVINKLVDHMGSDKVMVSSSCSLLHSPVSLALEKNMADSLKNWMAFAEEKCLEISTIAEIVTGKNCDELLKDNQQAIASRKNNESVHVERVRKRMDSVNDDMLNRKSNYSEREQQQKAWLKLPLLPTTTIGSFPQTAEIRQTRLQFKKNEISKDKYQEAMKLQIKNMIAKQEQLGLDVLVHGEPERNDMVEYFGQMLEGFCFTENGWVQSYGSRCVKPPIIYGDVFRPTPMTVNWSQYAQSLTQKPVKGMLTGPITILCWSFVRDDLASEQVSQQIALAIRDEVSDLEQAGIHVIQIDEPALREGMPLRERDHIHYLTWATNSFRLASSGVEDSTQIHTHMCYSEFNTIMEWIARMDADVISIESSRSRMELLDVFKKYEYPNEIGPGIYDIHSPRIPTKAEIIELLKKALKVVPKERLWVNPDCGLKTRQWSETIASLKNMVDAAKALRVL